MATGSTGGERRPKVGIVWRGDPRSSPPPDRSRFRLVFEALEAEGIAAEPVLFAEDRADEVRARLLREDGVLVWVDPISDGLDRSVLDPLLRDVAAQGVWVSTHPDVILKMGTKDVLVTTRDMGWGSDTHRYVTWQELRDKLPQQLAGGPRVLKQHRGNGGNGVWRVELVHGGAAPEDARVRVLHAQRGSALEEMSLGSFLARCAAYFDDSGGMVDQPFQPRLSDGMIRCYLVQDRVAGFGHQFVTALLTPPAGSVVSPTPPPRLYYGPTQPEFQRLKATLEAEWVPEMQERLGLGTDSLPALWDADFLLGPKDEAGEDSYVLCEINVSSVSPFPDEAARPLAVAVRNSLNR